MATRRMRIKATINVPRGGIKAEPQEQTPTQPAPLVPQLESSVPTPASPAQVSVPSPAPPLQEALDVPKSPGGGGLSLSLIRSSTPPVSILPSSPKSPSPAQWHHHQPLQRPSPSKSPAGLPPSGSILRRSPSPALSRLTNSPGPPVHYPSSPVKSPVPSYASPLSPVKFISRTPVMVMPTSTVSLHGGGILRSPNDPSVNPPQSPSSASPVPPPINFDTNIKSPPVNYLFRPPPSPSSISHHQQHDFHSIKSPSGGVTISRPSPAQSPVYGISRPPSNSSASSAPNFLSHHFNSNSNSADSHEVATLMGASTPTTPGGGVYPLSPFEKRPSSSSGSRGSHGGAQQGAFSSVSSNVNPSPSFAKTMFDNPESLKKRSDDLRKKEAAQPNPTKFAAARKEFFDKLQSGQAPERSKLTMLHFTFYNPPNPDKSSKLALTKRKSRSRASSVCSDASSIVKLENEGKNDENAAAKANSAPSSIAGSRRTTASSVGSGGSCAASDAGSVASNASSGSMPGPRVKVGPDGQLILDEKSLVVETSESQRARQQIEDMEVVSGAEYAVGSSGFYRYKKNYRRGQDWTERETIRFYRALNQCGTDFSMMLNLFPNRTRQELKAKFKREDRRNPDMVSKALASCIFDPDEGISSDEELSQIYDKSTEKERLLNEEKEVEVICSSEDHQEDGKKKKIKGVKKKIEFSTVQMQEMKALAANTKGLGTGKGRKWNTPVEGLPQGKLLPPPVPKMPQLPFQPLSEIKVEDEETGKEKPKKKYTRKKKQAPEEGTVVGSTVVTPGPTPGTVSIIISTGVVSTPSVLDEVKTEKVEKPDEPSKSSQEKKDEEGGKGDGAAKRRSRLPKAKPNLKRGGGGGEPTNVESTGNSSSQSSTNKSGEGVGTTGGGLCDDFFRFETLPAPLPVVQETDLIGNEEGSEALVIVDLDELNSIQKEANNASNRSLSPTKITPPPKKRKNTGNTDGGLPVVTTPARVVVSGGLDPYGKTVMAAPVALLASKKDGEEAGCSAGSQPSNKKVKVLPYRVPGPGGTLPSTNQTSLADELEIEIEMSTASNES